MSTEQTSSISRPEAVTYALIMWTVALCLEALHSLLQMVIGIVDPAEAINQAREAGDSIVAGADDTLLRTAVVLASVFLALWSLALLALFGLALKFYATRHRFSPQARRALMFLSAFLGLRALVILGAAPTAYGVPDWLLLLDGAAQICAAVAAVLGSIFSSRRESREFNNVEATHNADSTASK